MDELPTVEEIIKAVISGCRGLPWAVIELNIEEALRDYRELVKLVTGR